MPTVDSFLQQPAEPIGGSRVNKWLSSSEADSQQLNFVQRYRNPSQYPSIDNGDGTISTHRMASGETDGRFIAYPTIVQTEDGSLQQLEDREAFEYAMANNEFLEFPTDEEARAYADNGYKVDWGAGGTGGSRVNRWLSGNEANARLQVNADAGSLLDPDQQSRVYNLQTTTGLPSEFVERNLDYLETESNKPTFNAREFRASSPIVADFMAQSPTYAAIVQDDIENLSWLERTFKGLGVTISESFKQTGRGALVAGLDTLDGGIDNLIPPGSLPYFVSESERIQMSREMAANLGITDDEEFNASVNESRNQLFKEISEGNENIAELTPPDLDTIQQGIRGGLTSLAIQAPLLALSLVTRSSAPSLLGFGAVEGFSSYGEARESGKGQLQATAYASVNAAIEIATERLPTKSLIAMFGKGWRKELAKFAIGEITGEQIATLTQSLNAFAHGLDEELANAESASDVLRIQGQRAAVTLVSTLVAGGTQSGTVSILNRILYDAGRVEQAGMNAQAMNDALQAAQQSATRGRSQEAFQALVSNMKENGDVENVYVPIDQWNKLFQDAGVDPKAFADELTGNDSYAEAQATGGDIMIPLDMYITKLAGTEYHAGLVQDIRFNAEDMTLREAEEWKANAPSVVQDFLNQTAQQSQDTSQAVYEDVLGQLLGSGVERSVAETQAKSVQAILRTLGERAGVNSQELYSQYGIEIARQLPEALRPYIETDTSFDPILDRLRVGDTPTDQQIYGESLIDFIRSKGGLKQDSELSARDAELAKRLPGQINLIQEDGMTVDEAATAASEAGYIGNGQDTYEQVSAMYENFLNALDEELRGNRQYIESNVNYDLMGVRDAMLSIEEELGRLGVILEEADNGQIKALLVGNVNPRSVDTDNPFSRFFRQVFGRGQKEDQKAILEDVINENGETESQENQQDYVQDTMDSLNELNPQLDGVLKTEILSEEEMASRPTNKGEGDLGTTVAGQNGSTINITENSSIGAFMEEVRHMIDMLLGGWQLSKWLDQDSNIKDRVVSFLKDRRTQGDLVDKARFTDSREIAQALLDQYFRNPELFSEVLPEIYEFLEAMDAGKYRPILENLQKLNEEESQTFDYDLLLMLQQAPAIESEAFKNWFGDSKVVDENGEPLVVYHGTNADIDVFKDGSVWASVTPELAAEYAYMRGLADNGMESIMPVYMRIENIFNADLGLPKTVTANLFFNAALEQAKDQGRTLSDEEISKAKEYLSIIKAAAKREESGPHYSRWDFWNNTRSHFGADGEAAIKSLFNLLGFDGVKMVEADEVTYGAFSSNQIKSATGNRGTFDPNNPNILYQSVYHGSSYQFDKFSLSAIGSGEGFQAYGWGLYFSGRRGIGEYYKNALSLKDNEVQYKGKTFIKPDGSQLAVTQEWRDDLYRLLKDSVDKGITLDELVAENKKLKEEGGFFKSITESLKYSNKLVEFIKSKNAVISDNPGSLYQVEIPEDSDLLDWSKTIQEQPTAVKNALKESGLYKEMRDNLNDFASPMNTRGKLRGENIYAYLEWKLGSDRAASERLNEIGIPGLKYPAGKIAGTDNGGVNYVIWDENTVTVEAVNDELRQAESGNLLFQEADAVESEAFKNWFGDSKVVDENGEPMVVYHGGTVKDEFNPIAFFTPKKELAELYIQENGLGEDGQLVSSYLSIKNPAKQKDIERAAKNIGIPEESYDVAGSWWLISAYDSSFDHEAVVKELQRMGFDGAFIEDDGDFGRGDEEISWVAFEPTQIKSAIGNRGTFDPNNPNILYQSADPEDSDAFKAWAGTDNPVIESNEINDTDFSGEGPYVMKSFHGTTHDFDEFNAGVRGTKEGQFGAVNYFTSSEQDATDNYAGAGPDLTNRIEFRAERLQQGIEDQFEEKGREEVVQSLYRSTSELRIVSAQVADMEDSDAAYEIAKVLAKRELAGENNQTLEVYIRTEKPFVVGVDESPWIEFVDLDALQEAAIERVAYEHNIEPEEVTENIDDYEDEVAETRYEIESEEENPLITAIQKVADRYEFDASDLFEKITDVQMEGTTQSNLEQLMRDSESLAYAEDPETDDLVGYHALGEIIQELGYDSIILKNANSRFKNMNMEPGTAHIHVFDENNSNIKSVENVGTFSREDSRILFQDDGGEWYSGLLKAANGIKQAKGSPDQMFGMMKNQGGVKQEELDWTGLETFLAGKKSVTKDEIVEYLQENMVQVETVSLDDNDVPDDVESMNAEAELHEETDVWYVTFEDGLYEQQVRRFEAETEDEAIQIARTQLEDEIVNDSYSRVGVGPEYNKPSLTLPGGTNYREVLLTLPGKPTVKPEITFEQALKDIRDGSAIEVRKNGQFHVNATNTISLDNFREPGGNNVYTFHQYDGASDPSSKEFRSGHFTDTKNILAWIRITDRIDADGNKVLFIEEIQSDWHQQGRKKGYSDNPEHLKKYKITFPDGVNFGLPFNTREEAESTIEELYKDRGMTVTEVTVPEMTGVPNAPFKDNAWVELAAKKVLLMAAEGGYDKVSWTTGQQQADRYDLSKQLNEVVIDSVYADGSKSVYVEIKNGDSFLIDVNADGQIDGVSGEDGVTVAFADSLQGKPLDEAVGKELAEKIMESKTTKTFSGLDLKIGGQGMISFYDRTLPNVFKKVAGKLDKAASVGQGTIMLESKEFPSDPAHRAAAANFAENNYTREATLEGLKQAYPDITDSAAESAIDVAYGTPQQSISITPKMADQAMLGQPLFSKSGNDKRGMIEFTDKDAGGKRRFRITLLEKANLSTFLHETGHLYFEVLGDLAERTDAPQQIKDDYKQILDWMGVKSRAKVGRSQHEQWARGFEAYLREGKSPSVDMQSVFSRFRAWLLRVYKDLKSLNVTLTDEVRAVFDRLVATDEEIDAASEMQRYTEMFTQEEALALGMNETEFIAYQNSVEKARAEAEEDLTKQAMGEISRETKKWWKDARIEMREEVAAEIHSEQVYRALYWLQRGTLPDGSEIEGVTPVKLDKAALVDMYGQPFLKRLPKPYVYTREGGAHPDQIASMFGYQSGDELVKALVNVRPMNQVIEAETDIRMRQTYGDMRTDGTIADKAMFALHNDKQADVMLRELQVLNRNSVSRGTITTRQVVKAAAQRIISEKRVRDLNLNTYRVAEAKASKEAFELAAKQDFDGSREAKRKQLLNHELYRAAKNAQELSQTNRERISRFSGKRYQETLGMAGADYQEQINAILNDYEFRNVSLKRLKARESLAEFLRRHESDIQPLDRPKYAEDDTEHAESLVDSRAATLESMRREAEAQNWRNLTINELQGVRDNAEMIWHLAKLKDKLIKNANYRELKEAAETARDSINDNANRKVIQAIQSEIPWNKVKSGVAEFLAKSRRIPQFIREMDGGNYNGVMWNLYTRPLNEATSQYTVMIQKHNDQLSEIYNRHYTGKEQGKMLSNAVKYDSIGVSLTKDAVLSVAMNWGNQVNRERLMAGENWSESQVQSLFKSLDSRDWAFVQDVWDYLETYKKPFFDNHKALFGVEPEEVSADPFVITAKGESMEMRGGYYPVKFDNTRAVVKPEHQMKAESQRAIPMTARTKAGASISRVQGRVAIPLKLTVLGVVNQHVAETIHHIAFDQPLLDVARVLTRKEVSQAITEHYGKVVYDRLYRQLVDIKFGVKPAEGAFERFIDYTRNGASIAGMAMSVTTTILQPLGISNSLVSLRNADEGVSTGYYWMLKGLSRMVGTPKQIQEKTAWVTSNSEFMRYRRINPSREIGDVMNRIRKKGWRTQLDAAGFWMIANTQFFAVDLPTWYGAYEKSQSLGENHETSVQIADQTVRDAQGGGELIDQTEFQRGGPYMRIFTNFISYVATTWSIAAAQGRTTQFNDPAQVMRYAHDMVMLMVIPAVGSVLLDMLASAARGDDDDEDKSIPEKIAMETALMFTGPFVGIRELQGSIRGFYGYEGPAGLTVFADANTAMSQTAQIEFDEAWFKSMIRLNGVLFHLPAVQIERTTFGAAALYNGETDNPGALLFGPPRDN